MISTRLFVRHQKLQLVSVRIVEVNAMRIVGAAANRDAGIFQGRFDAGVVAGCQAQRQVIDFAAGVDFFIVVDLKQRNALVAAFQKTLPAFFMIDLHAEQLDVELSRAWEVFDMIDDVVDAADFERRMHIDSP